jgi:8-oxo-dGTP diphosphatase
VNIVHAAAAVIQRQDGFLLMAQRPPGRGWSGWWEFPGGKIEENESPFEALQRELQEEINISANDATLWFERSYIYPDKKVYIYFFKVTDWTGEITPCENQLLDWQNPSYLSVAPILPTNLFVLKSILLPPVFAITNIAEMGEILFFERLKIKLEEGLKMIQVREKNLPYQDVKKIAQKILDLAKPYQAKVLINDNEKLARDIGADGVHYPSHSLIRLKYRPDFSICGASCHNLEELMIAQDLEMSFAVLSPIQKTKSHIHAQPIGWEFFSECANKLDMPIYALGGLSHENLKTSWRYGGHGIAMQRAIWE